MQIVSGSTRAGKEHSAKILLLGPTGVGKTSLLRGLDPDSVLFVDVEAGGLAVADIAVDTLRPRTWPQCRDLAVTLAGPNPAVPPEAVYSEAHYNAVKDQFGDPARLSKYKTFFVDSITAVGRLCFAWSSQAPEVVTERGKKNLLAVYGLHAREALSWLGHIQQARDVNVIFLGVLETVTDDFNRTEHRLQFEGTRTGRELPAVVDEVITYAWIDFDGDAVLTRSFICTSPNRFSYPAKDRSGRLEQFEPPDLNALLSKLTKPRAAASPPQPQPSSTSTSKPTSTSKAKGS
jgi:hypothetical protein